VSELEPDDAPRTPAGPGFSDALTFSFADPAGAHCGVARLGLSEGGASGLVMLFRDGEEPAVEADGEGTPGAAWDDVRAAGLATETLEPGGAWALRCAGPVPFDLRFDAVAPALVLDPDSAVGRAGGMEGFDHVCRVSGTFAGTGFAGMGQRGRSWGAPDWERMSLARTITAWFDDEHAFSALAVRPAKAASHADEAVTASLLDGGALDVSETRLSTTYDAEERQRAAGLELHLGPDEEFPRRLAGEVVAGTSLDLGRLRLDCAFFRWRWDGRVGTGRYDVLRRIS
jgi:hypothetical protein